MGQRGVLRGRWVCREGVVSCARDNELALVSLLNDELSAQARLAWRLSAGRSTVVSVARAVSVKGAPAAAVGTSRWRTGSRILSLDVHCARTSGGGGGRCEDGCFDLVWHAGTLIFTT